MEKYVFAIGINDGLGLADQTRRPRALAAIAQTLEQALEKVRPKARAFGSPTAQEYVQYRMVDEELEKVKGGKLEVRLY